MELILDASQRELRDVVARFCADRFGLEGLALREAVPPRGSLLDRRLWQELADLGLLGMLRPDGIFVCAADDLRSGAVPTPTAAGQPDRDVTAGPGDGVLAAGEDPLMEVLD